MIKDIEQILTRGVAEIIVESELRAMLAAGRPLRLKEGFDPSSPDIHLGHMVGLRKLRQLQELGHQVVLVVGDWTGRIGDPSGASITRPMLTAEQVTANAQTYMAQFFKIADKSKTEVRWQSEWYGKFGLTEVISLTSKFTVAQMLAREDFAKRFAANRPIAITELLYPLLQAYDSVAIHSSVEFGGTDQKFNLLVGRELQLATSQPAQQLFMVPILTGTDGRQKMSKSLGNYIGVAEPPEEIFGKLMSIPDDLIIQYFDLLTDITTEELAEFKRLIASGSINPMLLKKRLAAEIIVQLYDEAAAQAAEVHFARVCQQQETPNQVPECPLPPSGATLLDFLVAANLAASKGQARRLISQGAVDIDGQPTSDPACIVVSGSVIRAGKRRYARAV